MDSQPSALRISQTSVKEHRRDHSPACRSPSQEDSKLVSEFLQDASYINKYSNKKEYNIFNVWPSMMWDGPW